MPMRHLTKDDYAVTRWSGGNTTQIAISPPDAAYIARDFLWRLSSASVDDERSTFTPLPDYHRCLLILEGALTLTHDGGTPVRLEPFQPHDFDGASVTEAVGLCRDFNLMLRKGKCQGGLRSFRFSGAGEKAISFQTPEGSRILLLYCANGSGTARFADETCTLGQGESLLMEDVREAVLHLSVPDVADFILAEILL